MQCNFGLVTETETDSSGLFEDTQSFAKCSKWLTILWNCFRCIRDACRQPKYPLFEKVGTKSGHVGTESGQSRDISGHSENHNYVEWNGREHQKTIRPMHIIIEVTVFVFSLCYPHRNLLYQSTTKIVKKTHFFIQFGSCLVLESCLRAPTLPKTCRKKIRFFLRSALEFFRGM